MLPSDPHTSCLTALGEDGIRAFPLLLKWLHWSTQKGQHRGVASQLWAGRRGSKPAPSLRTLWPWALMTLLCVTTSSSVSGGDDGITHGNKSGSGVNYCHRLRALPGPREFPTHASG